MIINPRMWLVSVLLLAACGGSDNKVSDSVADYNEEQEQKREQEEMPPVDCSDQPDLSDVIITGIEMNRIQQNIDQVTDDEPERHYVNIHIDVEFDEPDAFHASLTTSCEPPELGERAVRLELTSDSDFNADYPAGTVLNDLLIDPPDIGPDGRAINSGRGGLWDILLSELPTDDLVHRFTIKVELDSGEGYELTLDPLYFPASLPSEDDFPDDPIEPPGFSTSLLNDTGATTCGDNEELELECPVTGFPLQDAEAGRDALASAGELEKTGAGPGSYDFTKLDEQGEALPDDAEQWFCVRDNVTGLVWEVKSEDGVSFLGNTYSWYNPDDSDNGGVVGEPDGGECEGSACDTHAFVTTLNEQNRCGRDDWRLPERGDWLSAMRFNTVNWYVSGEYFYSGIVRSELGWWSSTVATGSDQRLWAVIPPYHSGDHTMAAIEADNVRQARAVSGQRGMEPVDSSDRDHCRQPELVPATPASAFDLVEDGAVVRHSTTNLEWQRCSLGQSWDGSGCSGAAEVFTWQQALNQVHDHPGWRLPNITELLSIYESCSSEPAINLAVFPDTPAASLQGGRYQSGEVRYWSATQSGDSSIGLNYTSKSAMAVDFSARPVPKSQPLRLNKTGDLGFVRLVRDVEP